MIGLFDYVDLEFILMMIGLNAISLNHDCFIPLEVFLDKKITDNFQ